MGIYRYTRRTVNSYLSSLYEQNVGKSSYLLDDEVEEMVSNIGIFKFKGYVYAFKNYPSNYSIDDVFIVYFFDKYLSRVIMDLTSTIETKLKTVLIELCYKQINSLPRSHSLKDNPFFYLVQSCYKVRTNLRGDIIQPKLTGTSVYNWHENLNLTSDTEYQHYSLYYKNNYNFDANRDDYLDGVLLLQTFNDINYPPFHYFMESATLGTVIYLIKNLQINQYDIIVKVARKFGIQNTRRVNFAPYLDRLNEVRNRAAHRERLFNRSL